MAIINGVDVKNTLVLMVHCNKCKHVLEDFTISRNLNNAEQETRAYDRDQRGKFLLETITFNPPVCPVCKSVFTDMVSPVFDKNNKIKWGSNND